MVDKIAQAAAVVIAAADKSPRLRGGQHRRRSTALPSAATRRRGRGMLPAGSATTFADVSDGIVTARDALFAGLRSGPLATHYFGHAGPELWADEGLLTVSDVASLDMDAPHRALRLVLRGGLVSEPLRPLDQRGAAAGSRARARMAAFGPTGATDPTEQKALYSRVYGRGSPGA